MHTFPQHVQSILLCLIAKLIKTKDVLRVNLIYKYIRTLSTRAAGECRRQVQNLTKKNQQSQNYGTEFHDHIWNHPEKRIQISTNMSSIGLVIFEIC